MPPEPTTQRIDASSRFRDLTVSHLLDRAERSLDLRLLAGEPGVTHQISSWELNRPGLAFAGFFQQFYTARIQILGGNEVDYLDSLNSEERLHAIRKVLEFHPPCLVLTTAFKPPDGLIEECDAAAIPLLATPLRTSLFTSRLTTTLMREFAPSVTTHGSLIDVFGMGVLITGKSGVGKSECGLELIARGHRLVADDVTIISRIGPHTLLGRGSEVLRFHMEIHGLGIIDVQSLYGVGAVISETEIDVHIHLEKWEAGKAYERVGIEDRFIRILDVLVPTYTIPIEPGRNLSILIETAALNQKMKSAGVNVAARFNEDLIRRMSKDVPRAVRRAKADGKDC
jgi:HPr kinase/phosphorylase